MVSRRFRKPLLLMTAFFLAAGAVGFRRVRAMVPANPAFRQSSELTRPDDVPTLALNVPTSAFVTSVAKGTATISPSVKAGRLHPGQKVRVSIWISAPSNPSHVDLASGTNGKSCDYALSSEQTSGVCDFPVKSTETNDHTGSVLYVVSLASSTRGVTLKNQPKTVTVMFTP